MSHFAPDTSVVLAGTNDLCPETNSPSAVVQSLLDLLSTILFFFHGVHHVNAFPILFRNKSERPTKHELDMTLFNEKVFEAMDKYMILGSKRILVTKGASLSFSGRWHSFVT